MKPYTFRPLADPGDVAVLNVDGFFLRSEITKVEIRITRGKEDELRQLIYYHFRTAHPETGVPIEGKVSKKNFIRKTEQQEA